ncbi:hypothetical protein SLS55_008710 [Diplodia seriata]|uniref:Uncharacterized protein n=1 Tax=Diplodia seriata TaxID=420778 RepID=A0ABR3C6Q4_9PEZI
MGRLAARLDSAKPADDSNASNMQSSDPFQPAPEDWGDEDSNRSRWVGRGRYRARDRGRRSSTLSTVTEHGRSGSDQTVRAGKSQEGVPETEGASIDLRSPAEFPLLSPGSAPHSSSVPNRARSSSTSSWAHVARLVSADRCVFFSHPQSSLLTVRLLRPDSSSTSDPAAVSDAGTVSTSPSSFTSDILDPFSLVFPAIPGMAPTRASGATLNFRRPLPPPTNANAAHQPDNPRRQLPVAWTGGLPLGSEKTTPVVFRQKSLGNLGRQTKAAHDGSTIAPKSPTKAVPFELATARRAAAREQKDRPSSTNKLVPAVPKTLPTSKAGSKTHSKAASSDTTSTSQYQTAAASPFPSGSSQSFATAQEEPYHALLPPGSPSRIPRLVATVGRSGAPRTSGSEPSPVRPDIAHEAMVAETASEPPADIQRTPSPAAPPMLSIAVSDLFLDIAKLDNGAKTPIISKEKEGKSATVDVARSEITKSDETIAKASSTVAETQRVKHSGSHVHFFEAPETLQNNPGLGIAHDPPRFSRKTSEHPTVRSQARLGGSSHIQPSFQITSPIGASAIHPEALSYYTEKSRFQSVQSKDSSTMDDTEQNNIKSPKAAITCPDTANISITQGKELESMSPCPKASNTTEGGSYGPAPESLFTAEMAADSQSPFNENQSSSPELRDGSQWSLHSLKGGDSFDASTIKGSAFASPGDPVQITTSKRISIPPHKRAASGGNSKATHASKSNATTPSRLNARAQEFVPGGIHFGSQVPATANRGTHVRPQMPPEWVTAQPTNYAPSETLPSQIPTAEPTGSSTWKRGKKKKAPNRFPEEQGDLWDRPSDRDMSAYNPHPSWSVAGASSSYGTVPGRFGTPMGQYGTPAGLAGGSWSSIASTAREVGSGGALRSITNASYGHMPQMARQPSTEAYLGRGGSGISTGVIPKGDKPVEKWWNDGWTSTNGGPLTHGAVYDYLRSTANARENYPSIFRPLSGDEASECPSLKPCGSINMVGAFEALPHYPLLCPKCQPDFHESMRAQVA